MNYPMGIAEDIKQPKFRNEWQKALINIMYTHNWLSAQTREVLKPFGITQQQFNVLRILRGQNENPVSTSVIRDRMLDKMSDASRIVDRLCKQGLVKRKVCEHDKRLVDVVISKKGLELLDKIDGHIDQIDNMLKNLSEEEAQQLNTLLDKARERK